MAFVVTEPCFDCKHTECAAVCPCECFHEGEHILYIDPVPCIDCEACQQVCPTQAIFHEDSVPDRWREFIALNEEMAPKCPSITDRKPAL